MRTLKALRQALLPVVHRLVVPRPLVPRLAAQLAQVQQPQRQPLMLLLRSERLAQALALSVRLWLPLPCFESHHLSCLPLQYISSIR